MQKVGREYLLLVLLPLLLAGSPVAFGAPDPAVVKKIEELTRKAVAEQRQYEMSHSKEAHLLEVVSQRFANMLLRIETMQSSLHYYSRLKRKFTIDIMDRMTPEVARACCPLNPSALQGDRWYFKGRGNKLKGKGLSGLREGKSKGKNKGKGKGRRRGRGGNGTGEGADAALDGE